MWIEVDEEVAAELGRRRQGIEPVSATILRECRRDDDQAERRDLLAQALGAAQ